VFSLRDMHMNRCAFRFCEAYDFPECLITACVRRMRTQADSDPLMSHETRVKVLEKPGLVFSERRILGHGTVSEDLSNRAAKTRAIHDVRNCAGEKVHIIYGGHSEANAFKGRELRSDTNEILVYEHGFEGKDSFEKPPVK